MTTTTTTKAQQQYSSRDALSEVDQLRIGRVSTAVAESVGLFIIPGRIEKFIGIMGLN